MISVFSRLAILLYIVVICLWLSITALSILHFVILYLMTVMLKFSHDPCNPCNTYFKRAVFSFVCMFLSSFLSLFVSFGLCSIIYTL